METSPDNLINRNQILSVIKIISIVAVAAALLFALVKNIKDLKEYDFSIEFAPLGLSFILIIIMYFLASVVWNRILRSFDLRHNLTSTARTYFLGLAGKYIPGKVWVAAIRVLHLNDIDDEEKPVKGVLSTVIIEHMYHLSAGILLIAIILDTNTTLGVPKYPGVIVSTILSIIVVFSPNLVIKIFDSFTSKKLTGIHLIRLPESIAYFLSYIFLWILLAFATSVFVSGLLKLPYANLFNIGLAYAASVIIGFIILPAPGGLGVREGSFVLLTANILSPSMAVLLGIALRVLLICAEISGLIVFYILEKYYNNN
jgi:hypothetical protein